VLTYPETLRFLSTMRPIVLFIAASLDGYIARSSGEVDWLFTDQDYGYADFLAGVDTVLMGRKTFEQVMTFGEWLAQAKQNYVFSTNPDFDASPHAKVVHTPVEDFAETLRQTEGKAIWLVGGAALSQSFLLAGLIDEIVLSIHPVLLSDGIRLFDRVDSAPSLTLISSKTYDSGLVQLTYRVKEPSV